METPSADLRRGDPLPIELVNTVLAQGGRVVDRLTSREQLVAWLTAHQEHFARPVEAVEPALFDDFRALREALRELLTALTQARRPRATAVELVNRLAARAPTFPRLHWPAGEPPTATVDSGAEDPGIVAMATVARAAIRLLGGLEREQVRACHAPGCVLFFVKDHPRREWCSASCGNRARVARHYRRRHPADPLAEPAATVAVPARPRLSSGS